MRHASKKRTNLASLGLTMVEMMVVLAVLTLMVGMTIPAIENMVAVSGKRKQKDQFAKIEKAFQAWIRDRIDRGEVWRGDGNLYDDVVPVVTSDQDKTYMLFPTVAMSGNTPGLTPVFSAGPCYLSTFFADECVVAGSPHPPVTSTAYRCLVKDAWGNYLDVKFEPPETAYYGPAKVSITSHGKRGPTAAAVLSLDQILHEVSLDEAFRVETQRRVAMANSALQRFFEEVPLSASVPNPEWSNATGRVDKLINNILVPGGFANNHRMMWHDAWGNVIGVPGNALVLVDNEWIEVRAQCFEPLP